MQSTTASTRSAPVFAGFTAFKLVARTAPERLPVLHETPDPVPGAEAQYLVFYEHPVVFLAQILRDDSDPMRALNAWHVSASYFLGVLRARAMDVTLCQTPCEDAAAQALTGILQRRFAGMTLPDFPPFPVIPDVFRAIAALEIRRNDGIVGLVSELQALSIGPISGVARFEDSIALLKSDFVARDRTIQDLRQRIDMTGPQVAAEIPRADGHQISALLTGQIGELQQAISEELGRHETERDTAAGKNHLKIEELQFAIEQLECEVMALRASTSWRVTRPLRGVSQILRK